MRGSTRRAFRSNAVAAAGVLAVGAAGYGVWQLLDGPDPQVIASGDAVAGDFTCAEASSAPADFPDGLLPEGAIAARLCAHGTETVTADVVPLDALTSRAADLVELVNGARRVGNGERSCNADAGPRWTMALQYPDGSVRSLAGEAYGCQDVTLGDAQVQGVGRTVVELFVDRLTAQRQGETPPADVPADPVACDAIDAGAAVMPWTDRSHLAAVALCWSTTPGAPFASVPLTPEQTEGVLADLTANLRDLPLRTRDYTCPSWSQVRITGRNAWGDPVTVGSDCREFSVDDVEHWVPSAPTLELLLDLSGQRMLPPPTP
ncbi:hypothetical protein INN71_16820 [Nocardioides sp. ChNu-153]|uniref:hypothetical protein n=1 Tax=unclassified Nocardioides TaxID=2615069 RepID=UPI00240639A0|nr:MULTISPECIES: hypothetical protein [unclassified Nocardioides]MDF9716662.1 hypothetical protein [Nocardioides sp. ChNu-99]MDN7123049.1 hypothetical protein [Nocardioides sp. ChNu-153]